MEATEIFGGSGHCNREVVISNGPLMSDECILFCAIRAVFVKAY